ncbi:PD-(D/E)XK motif protein [Alkalihalobacillus sp. R86527]|uniref:PD-(D/E)XK motif protein n=1 Tax=Alkalihalobacillus sp. R86527 TaxID=3093863 RepID=UPI003671E49D
MMEKEINIKHIFERMLLDQRNIVDDQAYKMQVINTRDPIMFAGLDGLNNNRLLYIDLGVNVWEQSKINGLPKWKGLSLLVEYFERISVIKDRYFLIIRQEEGHSEEIFEVVLQNLIDHILVEENRDSLFTTIYKVLDRWSHFFQKGGYRRLSDEQQRGLFGELWYIKHWMEANKEIPPLIVEQWEGPTSDRIDFKNSKCGVEIKTAVDKLTKTVKISNEKQLKLSDAVSTLYLYVCFLERSKTHGMSLQELVEDVRRQIGSQSDRLLLLFNDMLIDLGFREEEYNENYFFVDKVELYEANNRFPRICSEKLPKGISHVSYSIDLTHCIEFERSIEQAYTVY